MRQVLLFKEDDSGDDESGNNGTVNKRVRALNRIGWAFNIHVALFKRTKSNKPSVTSYSSLSLSLSLSSACI